MCDWLLDEGYVVAGCSRTPVVSWHKNYHHKVVNLRETAEALEWVRWCETTFGRIDVLINNAAIANFAPVALASTESVAEIFATNVVTPILLCREASRIMAKNRKGRIVNLSSVASSLKAEGTSCYASSKAALETFTTICAKEVAELGITCNALALSYYQTQMASKTSERAREHLWSYLTVKRELRGEEILTALAFLLSDHNTMVNGQVFRLGF